MTESVSPFSQRVLQIVAATAPGDILTYGEVAREAGHPTAARAVGHALSRHGGKVAWWRVVSASGRLVPGRERDHRAHLEVEGIRCGPTRVSRSRRDPASTRGQGPDSENVR